MPGRMDEGFMLDHTHGGRYDTGDIRSWAGSAQALEGYQTEGQPRFIIGLSGAIAADFSSLTLSSAA